ncbi:superinfection exclusion B family protein [Pontibacter rugosus]
MIALLSGFLLFATEAAIQSLKLQGFIDKYGSYFGIAFLFSTGLTVMNFFMWLIGQGNHYRQERKFKGEIRGIISGLGPIEKSVLREFFLYNQSTLTMPIDDAVVAGLINQGLLVQASSLGRHRIPYGMFFPVSINRDVKPLIKRESLGYPSKPTNEEMNKLLELRPYWSQLEH